MIDCGAKCSEKSLGVGKKRDLRGPVAINDRLMVLGLSMTFGSRLWLADEGICGAVIAAKVTNGEHLYDEKPFRHYCLLGNVVHSMLLKM